MGSQESYPLTYEILELLTSHNYDKIDEGLKGLGLIPEKCPTIRYELYNHWTDLESGKALKRLLDAGNEEAPDRLLP
jgi:hypothetical protein